MEETGKGVGLRSIIQEFQLEELYMGEEEVIVNTSDVNRPGLPLTGFTELYQPHRMQIIGREEHAYLEGLDEEDTKRQGIQMWKSLCLQSLPV